MVIATLKSKEQLKAEKYMEDELTSNTAINMPVTERNTELLTVNIRSAVNLLLDEPLTMNLGFFPIRRVSHYIADYMGGETNLSQAKIDHFDYSINLNEGMIFLSINDKFKVLIAREDVELEVEHVDNLSLNEMSQRVSSVYRLGDDGVGYIDIINNVVLYLVYVDLFKLVDHTKTENSLISDSTKYSIDYFANNVNYTLCDNDSVYAVETSSVNLLKDTLKLFYQINPLHGHTELGMEAMIRNELTRVQSRNIVYEIDETDTALYGRIYTYYVDPITAELISKLITINEDNEITIRNRGDITFTLSDGQEIGINHEC